MFLIHCSLCNIILFNSWKGAVAILGVARFRAYALLFVQLPTVMAAKRALRNLYADLVQGIGADGTLHHYFSNNLITNGEKETIESERTSTKRNTKLVDALMRRDEDKAIKGIIKVLELEKEANENLLRKIEEEYPEYSYDEQPKSESTDNPDHDIPPKLVKVAKLQLDRELKPRYSSETTTETTATKDVSVSKINAFTGESTDGGGKPLDRYPMNSLPRGYCVIINNVNFKTMRNRSGSEWDADSLRHLFAKQLGFHVEFFDDLTSKEMCQLMDNVRKQDHSELSCLVVAILTHGINGELYGVDGKLVKVEDLTSYFDGTRCPTLAGKPKVFILQACRGGTFDYGVEATDSPHFDEGADETDGGGYTLLPDKADFLLAYATTPHYVSWRNSAFGTWFIKAFVDTMKERPYDHLMDIFTEVNRKVAEEYESKGKNKQMPAPVTMLRYKLFLPPPSIK